MTRAVKIMVCAGVMVLATLMPDGLATGQTVGWRTDGTGRYPDATPAIQWSGTRNVAWATPMPSWSNSTPVITGDRLFICSEPATLLCLRVSDGKIFWQRENGTQQLDPPVASDLPRAHNANGYSSPTPVTNGQFVYVMFGNTVAAGYDLDGNRRWIRSVDSPVHKWGHSSSPALASGVVAVLVKDLVGLDASTGQPKWRVPSKQSWGSPVATQIGDTAVFVTPNGQIVRAADGKVLWDELGVVEYCSPVIVDGVLYYIQKHSVALKLPDSIDGQPQELWRQKIKGDRHYASPLVHDGLIWAVSRGEFLTVLDAATGEKVDTRQLDLGEPKRNSAYPSITLGGQNVFIGSESGTTIVLELGREFQQVARNTLAQHRSSPVFVGGRMYVRTTGHLYCIEAPSSVTAAGP